MGSKETRRLQGLSIVVLSSLDPSYMTTYLAINFELVWIYAVTCTSLFYCISSIVAYLLCTRIDAIRFSLTNGLLKEIILSTVAAMGWICVCGVGMTVTFRTVSTPSISFGCIGVNGALPAFLEIGRFQIASGINAFLFLTISSMNLFVLLQKKVFVEKQEEVLEFDDDLYCD
ncbi:hypothetical protein M3Y99_00397900 [Aphelenchoides fujianensis]|nr:hypothetical protein M3Y99_00397900 [Aphelenchoides fujianensis]